MMLAKQKSIWNDTCPVQPVLPLLGPIAVVDDDRERVLVITHRVERYSNMAK
jgi:hypothetical protein